MKIWTGLEHSTKPIKVKIFDASVLSIFLYGCEAWKLIPSIEQKIKSFAAGCYRIILNIKRIDHVLLEKIYKIVVRNPLINTVRSRKL